MNPITQGLRAGYGAEEIIDFISKALPSITPYVKKAKKSGYDAGSILSFLSKAFAEPDYAPSMSQQEIRAAKTSQKEQITKDLIKNAALLGTSALAGRSILNAAPKVGNMLRGGAMAQTPGQMAAQPVAKALGGAAPKMGFNEMRAAFEPLNLGTKVESLAARNAPETIGALLEKQISPDQKKTLEKQFGKPFHEIVKDYAESYLAKATEKPMSREGLTKQFEETHEVKPQEITPETPQEEGKAKPTQKLAALPNGDVGTIIDEKQGIASVQLPSGQVRRQKLDELIEGPEDAAEIALELIKSFTPEEKLSAHHAVSFYDEEDKEGFFLFHNGAGYKVQDISPEEYRQLSTEVVGAKTTGKTPWGEWAAGEGSRGAAYNQIVKGTAQSKETRQHKPYKRLQVGHNVFIEFQQLLEQLRKKRQREKKQR